MNTKNIYSLLRKNKNSVQRSSLRTILLSAVLLFAGTASYAVAPTFVHGAAQTMSVCQDAVATQINSLLTVSDPDNGNVETWSVVSGPSFGNIVTGTTATVTAGTATPTGFTYQPAGSFSGTDVFSIQVFDGTSTTITTVTVTVKPLPAVQTFTGGGGYCPGGNAPIGLTTTQSGVSYQLYEAPSTAVGSPVIGGGSAISFGTFTNPVYYYAVATNAGCTASLPGVTVHEHPLPNTFNMTGTGAYCQGGTGVVVGLDGSETGVSYQLYDGVTPVGSPVAGTGSAIDFGLQTLGTYTAIATNNTTGCVNNMNLEADVTTLPLPTPFNVIGGGYYCLGGSPSAIMLDGSEANVSYQLIYLGFIPLGSEVAGTGDTLNMGEEFLPGNYTVVGTDTLTGCTNDMTDDATVNFSLPPTQYTITKTLNGHYCVGDTGIHIGLTNSSAAGVKYQLYRNDTAVGMPMVGTGSALDYGLFTTVGTYKIIATDTVAGCTRTMGSTAVVVVNPLVSPTVHITSGIGTGSEVCFGSIATFTAQTTHGGNAPFYEWKVNNISVPGNDSTYTYLPTNSEVLTVMVHSNEACARPDTASNHIMVNVDTLLAPAVFLDVNPVTSITPGTNVTITAMPTHGGPTPTYQWFKNGIVIPGAVSSTYMSTGFLNHDSVTCKMTSSGGCGGVIATNSVIITVFGTSVSTVSGTVSDVKLVPNPNKGAFRITGTLATSNDAAVSVEVTNMLGQAIYTNNVIAKNGVVNEQIQLGTSAGGMYILNLRSGNEKNVIRFVVEN